MLICAPLRNEWIQVKIAWNGYRLEEPSMPIATIQITREGTTPEQKAAVIKGRPICW